jgi:hypothetical protein
MALTPGSYVPQGQVGTGAAYVHEIKDRSGYVQALAESAKEQRVQQEKQMAKIKGFDYGKVVDPVMKQHISEQYKKGLTAFSEIVSQGGNISSVTTPEGIAFSTWQNQIKDEADTAARAEAMKSQFQTTVANNVADYDVDIVNAAISSYDNAQTPDQKLAAMVNFNPLYVRGFDYNKWINTQFDNAVKDVEVTDFGGDINKYQEVYNQKIDVLPDVLAVDPGYPIAELQWQRKKDKKEAGFQQENFGQFLNEQIDYQKTLRENKRESVAAKPNVTNVYAGGGSTPSNATAQQLTTGSQGQAINFPDLNAAFSGGDSNGRLAFWTADPGGSKVPLLVLKGGTNNPPDYGLGKNIATGNPKDNQAIVIKGSNLWQLRTDDPPVTLQPSDQSKLAVTFKDKNFTDENGNATGGEGSLIYKDQLGNKWLDLVDEASNPRHVLIEAGGLAQTYQDAYGKVVPNPLVAIAEANRNALAKALGVSWQEFSDKYFKNNLK